MLLQKHHNIERFSKIALKVSILFCEKMSKVKVLGVSPKIAVNINCIKKNTQKTFSKRSFSKHENIELK